MTDDPAPESTSDTVEILPPPPGLSEDIIAIIAGVVLLVLCFALTMGMGERQVEGEGDNQEVTAIVNPLKTWVGKPGGWDRNPVDSFLGGGEKPKPTWQGTLGVMLILAVFLSLLAPLMRPAANPGHFLVGFLILFALATLSYVLAGQSFIKSYNLEYALWALIVGLAIGNTIGKQAFGAFGEAAIRTEMYIKTGLVLLGAEVLFNKLMTLGQPGILIAWVVTPIVLITTFWFGQRVLKMKSASLNMTISADMSVCGVSAAIATAAACKAKKEELSVAIGLSLCFTAGMMVVMPALIKAMGLDEVVGGAWIGGTIDATGAVAVAGGLLGDRALEVAATVKMIQNILIGVIAFGVAVYWTTRHESEDGAKPKVDISEIWKRFPKFVLGFIGASIIASLIYAYADQGDLLVSGTTAVTKGLRGWLFCLAFVCIGIDMNFRQLSSQFHGGKPLILYICGQTLNLILTLIMAYLAFKVFFPGSESAIP
ncbi:putative sulfate exporter family transporter [Bremerella cremea]|uniref:Putative sulfate exporter family transporter n=1 Tax=Blastopirellula marina TaxID=124 RepID=A0A2S8FV18_9BACT|nr:MULTISPECIES: putative sulfate exporter family transporter [Pirellulaceae]PQO36026.1 putative sulfate exporter family transporter [Blastopirellula marina]RCS48703.1 putative sulfate exporter family transporter [Bremerella cremea]